ncbi:MAG: hypothetical protein ACE5FI_16375, partial [Anaerolineales bacterium]
MSVEVERVPAERSLTIRTLSPLAVPTLLTIAYVLLRFGSTRLDHYLFNSFGVFQTAQRFGATTWLWALNGTTPLRLERWLVVVVGSVALFYFALKVLDSPRAPRKLWLLPPTRRFLVYGAVAALFAAIFWLLRLKIAYGDVGRYEDYMLRGVLPGQSGPPQPKALFMSSPLTTLAFFGVHFGLFGGALSPEDSVALANVFAGWLFIVGAFMFVEQLSERLRPAGFLALATLPAAALFYGYREATAFSAAFMLIFLALA